MKTKASAPGKIILFGEHFVVYGVKAILCAIDKRITVTAENVQEEIISIKSNIGEHEFSLQEYGTVTDLRFKPLYYLAKKMIDKHKKRSGIKITVESDIPSGVGLGSSSACCVAAAAAISRLYEENSKEEILKMAIEAERTIFQNTSGADCTICAFGGMIIFDKKNGFSKIDYKPELHLVIANSNIKHSTEKIVSKVKKFSENNREEFLDMCKRESEIINQALTLLKNNDVRNLGKIMIENQEFLERLGISNEKIQNMIKMANNISLGAKITGAGGGGCIIMLTNECDSKKIIETMRDKNYDCFDARIDFQGLDTF